MGPMIGRILVRLPQDAYELKATGPDEDPALTPVSGVVAAEVVKAGSLKRRSGDYSEAFSLNVGDVVAVSANAGTPYLMTGMERCRWVGADDVFEVISLAEV